MEAKACADAVRELGQAWEPVIIELAELGIHARVEQRGGTAFCIVVDLPEGGELAWGVADRDYWGGSDAEGEHVFTSTVPVDAKFDYVRGVEHEKLAGAIALSYEALGGVGRRS